MKILLKIYKKLNVYLKIYILIIFKKDMKI